MDLPLLGTLILAVFALPYGAEVIHQVWLQARFLARIPEADRAALPPHPRRPLFSFLGSLRFQIAVLRYARRDVAGDPPELVALKRRMRASMNREIFWISGLGISVAALLLAGWRPIWP